MIARRVDSLARFDNITMISKWVCAMLLNNFLRYGSVLIVLHIGPRSALSRLLRKEVFIDFKRLEEISHNMKIRTHGSMSF